MANVPRSPYSDRRDAYAAGSQRFFTGKPCRRGHIAERYTSSGGCTECLNFKVSPIVGVNVRILKPLPFNDMNRVPDGVQIERLNRLLWANADQIAEYLMAPPLTEAAISQGFTMEMLESIGYTIQTAIAAGFLTPLVLS